MRSSRLVRLPFVICAAAFALSGCGITLMSFNQPVPSSQAAIPVTAITADAQAGATDSNRSKNARFSIRRWARRGR